MNRAHSRTSLNSSAIVVSLMAALLLVYAAFAGEMELLIILVVCFGAAFLLTPREYVIHNGSLMIRRPIRSLVFPLSSISRVTLVSHDSTFPSLRVFGIGGLLGFYGWYWFPSQGIAFVLARNRKHLTLIEFHDRNPIVISPDDSAFLANLGPITVR